MCGLYLVLYKTNETKRIQERKSSKTTLFIENEFFDESKSWLEATTEGRNQLNLNKLTKQKITRNRWKLSAEGRVTTTDNKYVVPKRDIYHVLSEAHSATAHRGRDKTERYIRTSHAGISQDVINLFISLCKLHQQQKSVTDHCKKAITKPIKANQFLAHVQIDLIDFHNLACECQPTHNWVLHVVDHFSKYSWMFPLKTKQTEEIAAALTNLFWMFGFPSVLHSDNGREFKSKTMSELCKKHKIKQVHGAPRTPSTQGLVERSNRTVKENIRNILKERKENLNKWCTVLGEAAYKKNITLHRPMNQVPYEVIFGMLPWKEIARETEQLQIVRSEEQTEDVQHLPGPFSAELPKLPEPPVNRKRKHVSEQQDKYNKKMMQSSTRTKLKQFHIDDFVSIKIDKVDKQSPLHPNVLLGKVMELENNYAKIVTKFGIISTHISTSRLNKCTQTNITFDYTKHITFSSACKMAVHQ